MADKAPIHGLYMEKLQTSLLYWGAARQLMSFSDKLSELMNFFAEQDRTHAIYLQAFMVELDDMDASAAPIIMDVHRIRGLGVKEEQEDEAIGKVLNNWMESLAAHERVVIQKLASIQENHPDLVEMSARHIHIDGLRLISEKRAASMERIVSLNAAGQVFARPEKTRWKCRTCGYTYQAESAQETCACCQAPQSGMQAGDWLYP